MGLRRFWNRRQSDPTPRSDDADEAIEKTRKASSLPSGVFKVQNPQVEAELVDGVGEVFLRHMATTNASPGDTYRQSPPSTPGNRVGAIELSEFVTVIKQRTEIEAPDLKAGLASERLWVLSDLVAAGRGVVRKRAAEELEEFVRRASDDDEIAVAFLRDAARQIGALDDREEFWPLTRVAKLAAEVASREEPPPPNR